MPWEDSLMLLSRPVFISVSLIVVLSGGTKGFTLYSGQTVFSLNKRNKVTVRKRDNNLKSIDSQEGRAALTVCLTAN